MSKAVPLLLDSVVFEMIRYGMQIKNILKLNWKNGVL